MATRSAPRVQPERIPFYRNVKVLGLLAQLIFLAVVLLGVFILYQNVTTALRSSRLPADFTFLRARAGIPIAEAPIPSNPNDSYARAFLIGFLKTLRVALVGVVFASLLGVMVGAMRLSKNFLVRTLAGVYVETLRNTPLVVQIVFWYTAVLTPIPPRISNPIELPFGAYFSNAGLALPWPQPSYRFGAWLPWLGGALLVAVLGYLLRRYQIRRSDRPGNAWLLPLAAFVVVAAAGYALVATTSTRLEAVTTDFNLARGRGVVFIDSSGDGRQGTGERTVPYALTRVQVAGGQLRTSTQNLTESRGFAYSSFRFPPIRDSEVASAEVVFADPEGAEGLSIHFTNFPSSGVVYRDRNNNGEYDPGEELNAESDSRVGFGGVGLILTVEGFERRVVADRGGQIRIPTFEPLATQAAQQEETARPAARSPASLFTPRSTPAADEEATTVDVTVEVLPSGPLVMSTPSLPTTNYFGGVSLSVNYLALLLALTLYTATFIAEIVRGGLQAVAKGQREAARALGLSDRQTFRLIVFPLALRIIMPPMISQYLNLTKNSSLAPFAAYTELFAISIIIGNQTGASVPVTVMIIASYLIISFSFAFVLNIVNNRMALVER